MVLKKLSIILVGLILCLQVAFGASVTLNPDGAGTYTDWRSSGCGGGTPNWQCVDETTADTSDFVKTGNDNKKETVTFSNSGLNTLDTVNSVTLHYYAQRDSKASNSCFVPMTRQSGSDYYAGSSICTTSSWNSYSHTFTTNPATGNAWSVSEVEALEAGMDSSSTNSGGRVAQIYAVVDYTEYVDLTPSASASSDVTSGLEPLEVNFDGTGTGGNGALTYLWNFGDGTNSTSEDPTHTYTTYGVYNATLTVSDEDGDFDVASVLITVNEDLTPTALASSDVTSGVEDLTVNFNGSGIGGNGALNYLWNFGNGSTSTSQNPSFTYTSAGFYNATLTVTDSDGDFDVASILITVEQDLFPLVSMNQPYQNGSEYLFSASLLVSGNGAHTWLWDFADGNYATTAGYAFHTYNSSGAYNVTVTVTDADGDQSSSSTFVVN